MVYRVKCKHCDYSWMYRGKSKYYITCPKCLYKLKSPHRKELLTSKKKTCLNPTERKAFNYLVKKGVDINEKSMKKMNQPDLVDSDGNGYEIKRIYNFIERGKEKKSIAFEENQIRKFSDDVNILIFEPFQKVPLIECKMGTLRKAITKKQVFKNIMVIINKNSRKLNEKNSIKLKQEIKNYDKFL